MHKTSTKIRFSCIFVLILYR